MTMDDCDRDNSRGTLLELLVAHEGDAAVHALGANEATDVIIALLVAHIKSDAYTGLDVRSALLHAQEVLRAEEGEDSYPAWPMAHEATPIDMHAFIMLTHCQVPFRVTSTSTVSLSDLDFTTVYDVIRSQVRAEMDRWWFHQSKKNA